MSVQLGGAGVCGSNVDQPCVSVTLCVPGTSQCQVIPDVLLDTGSFGLRIFSQAITLTLPQAKDTLGNPIAECAQFGTGTTWGPVVSAGIQLGNEPVVQAPMQIINSAFASTTGTSCTSPMTDPASADYNGILGVGLFVQDCGGACAISTAPGMYFSCVGTTCTSTKMAIANQVTNPVALLPTDNNGLILSLPAIPATGQANTLGTLTLGIGTESNNVPSAVTTYQADTSANFTTQFNGSTYSKSFIDSGSNGLFFAPPTGLTQCAQGTPGAGWYCPTTTQSYSATNISANGTPSGTVNFQIANAATLFATGFTSYNDLGTGTVSGFSNSFDWGLPFFFGKNVFVGIEGKRSSLGTGPYWAY